MFLRDVLNIAPCPNPFFDCLILAMYLWCTQQRHFRPLAGQVHAKLMPGNHRYDDATILLQAISR